MSFVFTLGNVVGFFYLFFFKTYVDVLRTIGLELGSLLRSAKSPTQTVLGPKEESIAMSLSKNTIGTH